MSKVFSLKQATDLLNDPAYQWLIPNGWRYKTNKSTNIRYLDLPGGCFDESNCLYVKLEDIRQNFSRMTSWSQEHLTGSVILENISRPYKFHYFIRGQRQDSSLPRRYMCLWFESSEDRTIFSLKFSDDVLSIIPEKEPGYDFAGQEIDKDYQKKYYEAK